MTITPRPWGADRLSDPDRRADALRAKFARVSRRIERAYSMRKAKPCIALALVSLVAGAAIFIYWHANAKWTLGETLRHLLAAPNCASARTVGLAPAYRGQPGYWPKLDADKDGIACEPWPRRKRFYSPYSRFAP